MKPAALSRPPCWDAVIPIGPGIAAPHDQSACRPYTEISWRTIAQKALVVNPSRPTAVSQINARVSAVQADALYWYALETEFKGGGIRAQAIVAVGRIHK